MTEQRVELKAIRTDGRTQSRAEIHKPTVLEYASIYRGEVAGVTLPPPVLFRDGKGQHWLADGFHRVCAAKVAKLWHLDCVVHAGSQRDARVWAAAANANHGRRRSPSDLVAAVKLILSDPEWAKRSSRDVADHVGVSHTFVNNVRATLQAQAEAQAEAQAAPAAPEEPGDAFEGLIYCRACRKGLPEAGCKRCAKLRGEGRPKSKPQTAKLSNAVNESLPLDWRRWGRNFGPVARFADDLVKRYPQVKGDLRLIAITRSIEKVARLVDELKKELTNTKLPT